ncbi:MAG: DUF4399 domain-containing protein [Pseudomonadota bacterium]
MKVFLATLTALAILAGPLWAGGETPSNPEAEVYFINLKDGQTVQSPITIMFGLRGMGVAPSGTAKEMTGHHHLFVNRPPLGEGEFGDEEYELNIPADDNHVHFGGGQTETTIELPTGQHTLQLVLGDANHIPHSTPIVSDVITITVE